jgi:hypothetical protein
VRWAWSWTKVSIQSGVLWTSSDRIFGRQTMIHEETCNDQPRAPQATQAVYHYVNAGFQTVSSLLFVQQNRVAKTNGLKAIELGGCIACHYVIHFIWLNVLSSQVFMFLYSKSIHHGLFVGNIILR